MRYVLLATMVLTSACRATIPDAHFRCADDDDCPPQQSCFAGVCALRAPDAGPLDAGTSDAGDPSDGGPLDAGHRDSGVDAGPCAEVCAGATPRCDEERGRCVQCLGQSDCVGGVCDESGTCVECGGNEDCGPALPVCDEGVCSPCVSSSDCAEPDAGVCASGACVECSASDSNACDSFSCDLLTLRCSLTPRQSLRVCDRCTNDDQCRASERCVPTSFGGADQGAFCLTQASIGCAPPYSELFERASLSGVQAQYCGFDEERVTCEAIRALAQARTCVEDTDCGAPGALCATVGATPSRCTYACGAAADCPASANACGQGHCGS